ncbi:MAG: GNAT family N-acetyltransferase [Endomicrobiales bacterium]|nr:GNAT family N-acetyltransferase [Endomicrobiales bacterium]
MKVAGDRIYIKRLTPEDVTQDYVNWMNDAEVTQFLESRWKTYTLQDVKDYVKHVNSTSTEFMFGIFLKEGDKHIGNIKIGGLNQMHKYADIGLIIGEKSMWGKGFAAEAIKLATEYAFKEMGLNKIIAGIYEPNVGSYKAFLKCGYKDAARLRKHRMYKDNYVDEFIVEKLREW